MIGESGDERTSYVNHGGASCKQRECVYGNQVSMQVIF
jgi:hypothetical protein